MGLASKLLLILGILLTLHASWLPAKAWLSQQLIQHSWHQTINQQTSSNARASIAPWPWADTVPVAELVFERLTKRIVVLNGGDPTTLAFSAGAVAPFNQPQIHQPFVVAGHRDSHFSFLEDIELGDVIKRTNANKHVQHYLVDAIDVVDGTSGQLALTSDQPDLVLITCYPFGQVTGNTEQRYVVTAKPMSMGVFNING